MKSGGCVIIVSYNYNSRDVLSTGVCMVWDRPTTTEHDSARVAILCFYLSPVSFSTI